MIPIITCNKREPLATPAVRKTSTGKFITISGGASIPPFAPISICERLSFNRNKRKVQHFQEALNDVSSVAPGLIGKITGRRLEKFSESNLLIACENIQSGLYVTIPLIKIYSK